MNDADAFSAGESEPELDAADLSFNFSSADRPAGWDLSAARHEAEKPLPFQTSVDAKIRATLTSMPVKSIADAAGEDENDDSSDENEQKTSAKRSKKGKSVQIAENASVKPSKKGKKRLRNETSDASSFADLNLSRPLLKAVSTLEWNRPTPVQSRAIPYILAGRDVCGSAVTGSGKTGAFVLPVLERLIQAGVDNVTRVVILLPTRELAAQCHSVITNLSKYTSIRAALAVGGLSNIAQEAALRTRPHILVATPGRLIDHIRNAHSFSLEDVEILIMDEADRLLEMGFQAEVEEVVRHTPRSRQTLLFSATMNSKLSALVKLSLDKPAKLAVDPLFDVAATLSQEFIKIKTEHECNKDALLFALASRSFKSRVIIFFREKIAAHRFRILFGLAGLKCAELHGNLTQAQRLLALDEFRQGSVDFLLCTDLAARGLDIAGVQTVVNYDMPREVVEYIHRAGRTARAGAAGRVCSLVCSDRGDERRVLNAVGKRAQAKLSARTVPPAVVGKYRALVDSLAPALRKVLREERTEKQLRVAERDLAKAGNILKHEGEIYSRPKRSWFQTRDEREEEGEKVRKAQGFGPSRGVLEREERKKRKTEMTQARKEGSQQSEVREGFHKQKAAARKMKRKKAAKNKK